MRAFLRNIWPERYRTVSCRGTRRKRAGLRLTNRFVPWTVPVACLAIAAWAFKPTSACAATASGECFDFSEYLPEEISIDGCWDCDVDVHWLSSLFSWSWKVTLDCTSEDGSSYTVSVT